jgi:predicted extracellular nuclease
VKGSIVSWVTALMAVIFFTASAAAQKPYSIAEIQGSGNASPHVGENVTISGVVTARTRTGFFLQTQDEKADKDPSTSEGIFVFTKSAAPDDIVIGSIVKISGEVEEYRGRNDQTSLTTTELSHRLGQDSYTIESKETVLPKPISLTAKDFSSNSVDEIERYEGMRVTVPELTVVAPTGGRVDIKNASAVSNGIFFGVIKGIARPFREPGLDIRELNSMSDRDKLKSSVPKLEIWDSNPEIIRIDTLEQQVLQPAQLDQQAQKLGSGGLVRAANQTLEAPSFSELQGLTGVLHYFSGRFTLLKDPDNKPNAAVPGKVNPLPVPTDRQFSVAGMNLENFFDDVDDPDIKEDILTPEAFARRLKKVSMTIRDLLQMPDVIGAVEVENLSTLKRLADKVNSDAVTAGRPDPKYVAYLEEGNDGRGIDVGFLVRSSRVKVIEVKQFGKADKFKNPDTGDDEFLNDRPPLMIRVAIDDARTGKPFEMTLIVNHLKSFLGYSDPKQMANVRLKKRLQAEFLARYVQDRLKADPTERIALLGDLNAFQFNDGVMDVVGTIEGKPASKDVVLMPSTDLVDPDLTDLVDLIEAKQKYSYTFDGSAQAIDHMIISPALVNFVKGFGYVRVNADYPESYRNDDSRPERYSDHDPAVAVFSLDGR